MNNTIFDLIEEELPEGKEGYFELAKNAPEPKDDSFLNNVSDYAKTFLKGTIEGATRLGRIIGPIPDERARSQDILKQQTETLDKLLPTDEGYLQRGLRRGLREAPTALSFPGSSLQTLPRAIAAGFIGEGAKDLGLPEWAQSAAEITAYIGPDVTKKLLEKGKNKEIIEFGKKMGMTDQQITPLIQSEFKQKWLSKISPKRGSTEKALGSTHAKLGETYGILQKSKNAGKELAEHHVADLKNSISEKLKEMPSEVREKIKTDLSDLLSNKITGDSLINFYKDVSHNASGASKQLFTLKEPIKKALSQISPDLGKDFEMINKLYTKYYPIASRLKPNITSDLIAAGEALGVLGSFTMGYYPPLYAIAGEKAAKKIAQQMLINPRFQQISQKMVKAMNENKFFVVKKLTKALADQTKRLSPEVSEKLSEISDEDIENLLKAHQRTSEQKASQ